MLIKTEEEVERKKMKPTCVVPPLLSDSNPKGFTGLDNLGNTCFMSSVIQILANTTFLRDFFLSSEFQAEINRNNPLGSGGKLVLEFAVLIRVLWDGSRGSFAPSNLKRLVGEKATHFRGFAQHDAQEFLAFLLDGLHEDLNRVLNKPYLADISLDDLPEQEAAKETWRRYKLRNDSFVVDKFQGQYRSKLICPECDKVSVTFDPYMYLSVPIPKKKVEVSLLFFRKNGISTPCKVTLFVPNGCGIAQIGEELSSVVGVQSPNGFRYMEVEEGRPKLLDSTLSSYTYSRYSSLRAFEVDLPGVVGEEIVNITCIQRTLSSSVKCAHCATPDSAVLNLKRCTRCRTVFYCNSDCQKAAWPTHKKGCRQGDGMMHVGEPFMVSLPRSELTYRRLASAMESSAQYSVNLFKPPRQVPASSGDMMPDSENEQAAEMLFRIKQVKSMGNSVVNGKETTYLTDKGDEILDIQPKYLALDWQYNKLKLHISGKDLEYKDVETSRKSRSDKVSLEQCLELFTKQETLSEDEAWFCPQCKTNREAAKQMYLWSLPDLLIVQLKRFSFRNTFWRDKIDEFVDYPVQGLDVRDFYVGPSTSQSTLYDLYGVVNHHGGMMGGHYTAYARCLDQCDSTKTVTGWRLMNDSRVSRVSDEGSVVDKAAYVLFYQRRAPAIIKPTSPLPTKVDQQTPSTHEEGDEDKSSTTYTDLNGIHESKSSLKELDQSRVALNEFDLSESDQSKINFGDSNKSNMIWNGHDTHIEMKNVGSNHNDSKPIRSDVGFNEANSSQAIFDEPNQSKRSYGNSSKLIKNGGADLSKLSDTFAELSICDSGPVDCNLSYTDMDVLDD